MSFTTTLAKALRSATRVVVDGYEIDCMDFFHMEEEVCLSCGDDYVWSFDDQEITIGDFGTAAVPARIEEGEDQRVACITFYVEQVMKEEDLV